MTHICNIQEISSGYVKVEANNPEDALKQAKEIYECGDITWTDSVAEFETPTTEKQIKHERGEAMRFVCNVKEISYGTIEVEADSRQEAQDKAEAQYQLGNTNWSSGEYEIEAEEPKTNEKTMERGEAR